MNMRSYKATAPKSASMPNEDSVYCSESLIAVSDGAGGCGNYSDKWSRYIVDHLPSSPIQTFRDLLEWYEPVACDFYDWADTESERNGGPGALKFYEEGSCATIASIWMNGGKASWLAYGDSVVFAYDRETGVLQHSPISLLDFAEPPFLLNCNEVSLVESASKIGSFHVSRSTALFVASDALSHYLIATYYAEHFEEYAEQLKSALDANTYNSNAVSMILNKRESFDTALNRIIQAAEEGIFSMLTTQLQKEGVLVNDDFSFAIALNDDTSAKVDRNGKLIRKLKKKLRKQK